jgi:hypothetical protein
MHRGLIAFLAAILFSSAVAIPATFASHHATRKHRVANVLLVWKRATPLHDSAPLDAVFEEHKKAAPAAQAAPVLDATPPLFTMQRQFLPHNVTRMRASPPILASVLLL